MRRHKLKTWPPFFEDVLCGRKTFEVRLNDREYQVGDVLELLEWVPEKHAYTGRSCERMVRYVLAAAPFGVKDGYVVLGLVP